MIFFSIFRPYITNSSCLFFKVCDFFCIVDPDTHSIKNELNSSVHQNPGTPLIRKNQLQELQKSLQKVLSPVLNSSAQNENLMSNKICVVLLDPKAPKTPHVIFSDHDEVGMNNSPLGKFNASNSNLKVWKHIHSPWF